MQRRPLFVHPSRDDWPDDVKRAWVAHSACESVSKGRHGGLVDERIEVARWATERLLDAVLAEQPDPGELL